ncbi:MAG TPA: outer membrane beta-barrel protein [Vicinamibacterales bacterium]|jgi:opacity protein-like surface antigen|nr:outer membrane beta-barrel protein [Vicinamibacterales bacterium]
MSISGRLYSVATACLLVAGAVPVAAQPTTGQPSTISLRGYVLASGQRFTASETFETIFGQSVQPFWGAGLELVDAGGFYLDFGFSRFKKTGERAFFFEGDGFGLNTPLTVTITPLELTAGFRFNPASRVVPYVGGGIGSYGYEETSDFEDEAFEDRHVGYLAVGGVDFRISRWFGISADVQYTHVPGILGTGGVSQEAGETDLGGVAARFRVLFGR